LHEKFADSSNSNVGLYVLDKKNEDVLAYMMQSKTSRFYYSKTEKFDPIFQFKNLFKSTLMYCVLNKLSYLKIVAIEELDTLEEAYRLLR